MKVLICGTSKEQKEMISINQALIRTGYATLLHEMSENDAYSPERLLEVIQKENPDLIFPRVNLYPKAKKFDLENRIGTGLIQNHLSKLGINVVGTCGKVSLRNKAAYYGLFEGYDFKNDFVLINPRMKEEEQIVAFSGFTEEEAKNPFKKYARLFIKPNSLGRSFGITDKNVVSNKQELLERVDELSEELNDLMLIAPFYNGREFTIGVIGNSQKIFLPVEICQKEGYSKNKILLKEVKHGGIPTGKVYAKKIEEKEISNLLIEYSNKICDLLEITDYTRMDFRQDNQGNLHAIDVNGVPGLKYMESYIAMAAEYLMKKGKVAVYDRLISSIILSAAERFQLNFEKHPTLFLKTKCTVQK